MFHLSDCQLSAIDWIRSPLEVPMPTQREASPEDPEGAFGRTRVEVASRIHEPSATGPVLKAGPMAALTEDVNTAAAMVERIWREEGMLMF